jgi:hypothetical protein
MAQSNLSHFFPLSVYSAKLGLTDIERERIIEDIDASVSFNDQTNEISTWTGDVHGFHELHNNPVYLRLFGLIGERVRDYVRDLNINADVFDYYFSRSWATKQTVGKQVDYHRHDQSHISAVYYPRVPANSGDLYLATDNHQNEIMSGLFRQEHYEKGIVKVGAPHSMAEVPFKVEDDLLVIFPSKTAHRTGLSATDVPRYSIATDILCVLKDASDFEIGLPPIHSWKKA